MDNILKLGFAVVRSGEHTLTSTRDANIGNSLTIELNDGTLTAEITSINPKTK